MAQLDKVVRTHQPDKAQPREAATQGVKGVGGIGRSAQPAFEIADDDVPMPGSDPPRLVQPNRERRHACNRLQRVLWRDEPPHLVEVEALEGEQAQMQMSAMCRVERTAQQPDAAMPAGVRPALTKGGQGRTCPVPRTRYL